jgi:hypothetical protein
MAKLWRGVVEILDVEKKRLLLRGKNPERGSASDKEQTVVIAWNLVTRVTTPDRGLIPIQQLQAGQRICADCVHDQDGRWLARAIEVLPVSAPRGIGTGAQANRAKGGEGG